MNLQEILAVLDGLPPGHRDEVIKVARSATSGKPFVPQPGPQTEAYFSKADILLFGGCVSGDTEFLTPRGWKRIDEYIPGDQVAAWAEDGSLRFEDPIRYIDVPCEGMWHFSGRRLSMMLSPEHRVPAYQFDKKFVVKRAGDLAEHPSRHWIPVTFQPKGVPGIGLSDDAIRLMVAIHADGHFERKCATNLCRVTLRKERKKERLLGLLTALGIEWSEYHNPARPTEVRYTFHAPVRSKTFADWWGATPRQLAIILEEMRYWDGDFEGEDICFNTTVSGDADFMQYAAHACGRVATITTTIRKEAHHAPLHRVHITHEEASLGVMLRNKEGSKGTDIRWVPQARMYCFETSTSFWIARHDKKIFVTGNSPGGGKTALGIGLALNEHHRSMVVRKNFVDLAGCLHTLDNILKAPGSAVGGNRPIYRKPGNDGGIIEFVGLGDSMDGKQGNPHDYIYIDEAAQLPEDMIRMLIGWLRTDRPGQRCRVVMGSNPPLDSTGDWLIKYFAPWLDPHHPNPAQEGELRYFQLSENGRDYVECGPDDYIMLNGVRTAPQSRTFISSKFTDNAYYNPEEYAKSLAALPDSVRERLITGNFMLDRSDDVWQAIPTAWVKAAQAKWTAAPPAGIPMCAIGADIAQGGADNTVIVARYDGWFCKPIVIPGNETPDGTAAAAQIVKYRRDNASVIVDLGGGWGGECYGHLKANGIDAVGYLGVKDSSAKTEDRKLGFWNKRSEAYWRLREALDPSQPGGAKIVLPPDPILLADLCAPRYEVTRKGIKLESKESVVKRLGRSPDRGDAVAMCWMVGAKASHLPGGFATFMRNRTPEVIRGRRPDPRR